MVQEKEHPDFPEEKQSEQEGTDSSVDDAFQKYRSNGIGQKKEEFKEGFFQFLSPVFTSPDALTGEQVVNPGKVAFAGAASFLTVLGVLGAVGLTLRSNDPGPPKPQIATLTPVDPPKPSPRQVVDPAKPAPNPPAVKTAPQQVSRPTQYRRQGPTAEELRERARRAALDRVRMRLANSGPLNGAQEATLSSSRSPRESSPSPHLQRSGYNGDGAIQYQPVGFSEPSAYQAQASVKTSQSQPEPNGALKASASVNQWSFIPPNNVIHAATKNAVTITGQKKGSLVLAQVTGTVSLDGNPVVPDGAMLQGEVVGVDEATGRVSVAFKSISFGPTTLPMAGAMAFSVEGNSIQEGLASQLVGQPDYLASDTTSALGAAGSELADSLGQRSISTGAGPYGSYSSYQYDGSFDTAAQKAGARGVSTVFNRQTSRADRNAAFRPATGGCQRPTTFPATTKPHSEL
ncbi:MAG: hypothetical protein WCA07_15810 [Gloeobacterales cyanobacterium]